MCCIKVTTPLSSLPKHFDHVNLQSNVCVSGKSRQGEGGNERKMGHNLKTRGWRDLLQPPPIFLYEVLVLFFEGWGWKSRIKKDTYTKGKPVLGNVLIVALVLPDPSVLLSLSMAYNSVPPRHFVLSSCTDSSIFGPYLAHATFFPRPVTHDQESTKRWNYTVNSTENIILPSTLWSSKSFLPSRFSDYNFIDWSCQWVEAASLNCSHQRAHC
jgi:hypothetical protein